MCVDHSRLEAGNPKEATRKGPQRHQRSTEANAADDPRVQQLGLMGEKLGQQVLPGS